MADYLNRVGVAVVRLTDGDLGLADRVKITGRTSGLTQTLEPSKSRTGRYSRLRAIQMSP